MTFDNIINGFIALCAGAMVLLTLRDQRNGFQRWQPRPQPSPRSDAGRAVTARMQAFPFNSPTGRIRGQGVLAVVWFGASLISLMKRDWWMAVCFAVFGVCSAVTYFGARRFLHEGAGVHQVGTT